MDIIEKVHEIGKEIEKDEMVVKYREAKKSHDDDKNLQDKIGEFNLIRMNLMNESQKEDANEEKMKENQTKMQELYNEIMCNENMVEFVNASKAVEKFVTDVNSILNFYITGEEPQAEHDCGGDCGGCGGGCH